MDLDTVKNVLDKTEAIKQFLQDKFRNLRISSTEALMLVFIQEGCVSGDAPYWGTNNSYSVSGLRRKGLIEAKHPEHDARSWNLYLTPAGKDLSEIIRQSLISLPD